jgi:tape measure domain-containing protein
MASVDERVVKMTFDNASFERRISATIDSINQLNKALELKGAAKGISEVGDAADHVNLGGMASAVENISSKFSALGAVGFTVIQNLTSKAMGFVANVGHKVLGSIFEGGTKRAKNLEQARFLFEGLGADVEASMESARQAVVGTAYGLDEAAKTAAQFGGSGIKAGKEMTGALRGVAGVAGMTGSSFQEISDIFTSAAGQGKVTGYTLERISMRGINVAAVLGKQMGKTEAQIRKMASEGQIDFKTFAKAMDTAFGAHAQEANKTYEGSLANLHAAMSRLGAAVMTPHLTQQRDLFNAISPKVDAFTKAMKPLIKTFMDLKGVATGNLIKQINGLSFANLTKAMPNFTAGLKELYQSFTKILSIAGKAFKEVFPPSSASLIITIANAFKKLADHLVITKDAASKIGAVFKGVFSILNIAWSIVKEGIKFIASLVSELLGLGGGPITDLFVKVANFFTDLNKGIASPGNIKKFFQTLTDAVKMPIDFIKDLKDKIVDFFKSDPVDKVSPAFGRVGDRFASLKQGLSKLGDIWAPLSRALGRVGEVLNTALQAIGRFFKDLGKNIASFMKSGDFKPVLDTINTALLGGIALLIGRFLKGGININIAQGLVDKIGGIFDQLTGVLKAMETNINAGTLMKIAEAMAILTVSVIALSFIDSVALTKALTAMAVGFGELLGAFAILQKVTGTAGAAKFAAIAVGLQILAGAMLILSLSVALLAQLSWNDLEKGMGAIIILLGSMIGVSLLLEGKGPTLVAAGLGIVGIATGIAILAGAVKLFGSMSYENIGKGLLGVAGGLLIIAAVMKLMPVTMPLIGAGLLLVSFSLDILAGAMKKMATMSWGEIGKGLAGIAGALLAIGLAMNIMPSNMILTAAGLLLVSIALQGIAKALASVGSLSWGSIAKGLAGIAATLVLLAAAMYIMQGTIVGAVAIGIAAASLMLLAGVVKAFAGISWGDLLHGLGGIAILLLGIALAALAIEPAVPAMLALGAALMVIGLGFALFGAAAYLVAKAFDMLAKSGEKGSKAFVQSLKNMGAAIPAFATGFATALVELAKIFMKFIPTLVKMIITLLSSLLDGLITIIPKVLTIVGLLISGIINLIKTKIPEYVLAGISMILAILKGLRDNIPKIVIVVGEIITGFLDALATELPKIVNSVANLIIALFTSVATAVGKVAGTLMFGIGIAFMKGFLDGILGGQSPIINWFTSLAGNVLKWIGNVANTLLGKGRDFLTGLYRGISAGASAVITWFLRLAGNVLSWIGNVVGTLSGKGRDLITGLYRGVTGAIGTISGFFARLGGNILGWVGNTLGLLGAAGRNIMTGLYNGITSGWGTVSGWIAGIGSRAAGAVGNLGGVLTGAGRSIMDGLLNGITEAWNKVAGTLSGLADKIKSLKGPPKKDAKLLIENGMLIMQGLQKGIEDEWNNVANWLSSVDPASELDKNIGDRMSNVLNSAISDMVSQLETMPEMTPTITPVLDLTNVAAGAKQISDYISTNQSVSPTVSYAQARTIASAASVQADTSLSTAAGAGAVKFEQNIYAPTQLSTSDIYKNTRNQITMAKQELSIP